ncbi:MAG: HDIG domain-containing protein, partial [Bacteroidales bacterium]|nr:HDIG domain-containing protein [Bacteroidales bacterium]
MFKNFRKYTVYIYTAILFILSIGLFVLIFPKDKQFQYEYTEGTTWLYDDLYATSDFAIKKTEAELLQEKDSIKKHFIYYFNFDTLVVNKIISDIKIDLDYFKNTDLKAFLENKPKDYSETQIEQLQTFKKSICSFIQKAYKQGVIERNDSLKISADSTLRLKLNDVYELYFYNDFITEKQIRKELRLIYKSIANLDSLNNFEIHNILEKINFTPNIVFDNEISIQSLNNQIKQVSLFSGMIDNGSLIIKKGEKIGHQKIKILDSLKDENSADSINIINFFIGFGVVILFFALYYVVYFLYFYVYKREILFRLRNSTFFTFQFLVVIVLIFFILKYNYIGLVNIDLIPFTLFAALLISFFDFSITFFVYFLIVLLAGFFAPNGFEFIFTQSIIGMICMYSLRRKQIRQQIFVAILCVILSYTIIYSGFYMIKTEHFSFNTFFSNQFFCYLISSSGLLLYLPFVYIYEKIFGFLSDFTLNELSDTNSKLLKELAEKAPGTFQHCVQVANIVEAVTRELKADVLLARTGALYHDIGKIIEPDCFIENQHGFNMHDNLPFEKSAEKIISHVKNGLEIAEKNFIPQQIRNFIMTHHGTTITRYFYNSAKNQNPNRIINMTKFQYPGPKPKSMETAITMMADSIEAASRSLKTYSVETIQNLVNNIIDDLIANGQLDEVDITLKQIKTAKQIFVQKIINIYHT